MLPGRCCSSAPARWEQGPRAPTIRSYTGSKFRQGNISSWCQDSAMMGASTGLVAVIIAALAGVPPAVFLKFGEAGDLLGSCDLLCLSSTPTHTLARPPRARARARAHTHTQFQPIQNHSSQFQPIPTRSNPHQPTPTHQPTHQLPHQPQHPPTHRAHTAHTHKQFC